MPRLGQQGPQYAAGQTLTTVMNNEGTLASSANQSTELSR
jgi:hypothetical protein